MSKDGRAIIEQLYYCLDYIYIQINSMSNEQHNSLWESEAEARMLEGRLNGFWNPDYLKHILLPLLNLKPGNKVLDVGTGTGALTFY